MTGRPYCQTLPIEVAIREGRSWRWLDSKRPGRGRMGRRVPGCPRRYPAWRGRCPGAGQGASLGGKWVGWPPLLLSAKSRSYADHSDNRLISLWPRWARAGCLSASRRPRKRAMAGAFGPRKGQGAWGGRSGVGEVLTAPIPLRKARHESTGGHFGCRQFRNALGLVKFFVSGMDSQFETRQVAHGVFQPVAQGSRQDPLVGNAVT